ncbi:MAG TPA: 30S ribosomal protein S5 [Candidatus Saccharimonadales bacterium]|nr:30S ribosomal protein S5 [Candidatus Saccharimonadales bacterium]
MAITPTVKEFEEKVIAIDRVTRVVKGGRRFRFRATVVVGDGRGRVGVGVGKGGEVVTSIAKAVSTAKKHLVAVPLKGQTIPHEVEVRFSGAQVLLKPASAGTGVIAGGAIRSVIEAVGIRDCLSKSLGSSNKVNNAYATVVALSQLRLAPSQRKQSSAPVPVPSASASPAVEPVEKPAAATKSTAKVKG